MIATLISVINISFFCAFVVPPMVQLLSKHYKWLVLMNTMIKSTEAKIKIVCSIVKFMIGQWWYDNVTKLRDGRYELTYVINNKICKFTIEKQKPSIVDIQCDETGKSYMDEAAPYVAYRHIEWIPPTPSTAYFNENSTRKMSTFVAECDISKKE